MKVCGHREDAEDTMQDVLVKAIPYLAKIESPQAPGGETPLPANVRDELRRAAGIGAWNIMGGLYGTRHQVSASRRAIAA